MISEVKTYPLPFIPVKKTKTSHSAFSALDLNLPSNTNVKNQQANPQGGCFPLAFEIFAFEICDYLKMIPVLRKDSVP